MVQAIYWLTPNVFLMPSEQWGSFYILVFTQNYRKKHRTTPQRNSDFRKILNELEEQKMAVTDQLKRAGVVWEPVEAKPPKLHLPNSSGNTSVTAGIKALPQQQETKWHHNAHRRKWVSGFLQSNVTNEKSVGKIQWRRRRCCWGGNVTRRKCDKGFTVKDLMMHLTALAFHDEIFLFVCFFVEVLF